MTVKSPSLVGEKILNLGDSGDQQFRGELAQRSTDPVILPQPYSSPADFDAQYPTPLDPTEIIAMCEEVTLWQALPEETTALKQHTWRELNELAFTSGSAYISFADGECPEEYTHDGDNTTVTLKNIGAKKTLSQSDIIHSRAVAASNWHGINRLVGGVPAGEGIPGGDDAATFEQEFVADVKEKEIRLAMTLVLNGWDRLLSQGDEDTNSLEFTGVENWEDVHSCTFHNNDGDYAAGTGTFSATTFDRWLAESCAKPTTLMGHPTAIQELMSGYFQLGFQGSQVVNFNTGDRIVPGFNFAGFVNTGVGRLAVVSDNNFARTDAGNLFSSNIYAMRMNHNGVPLVYKLTQIPLALNDLVPGCSAISFQVWAKTSLIIKHCCAHGRYLGYFSGDIVTTCPVIG